MYWLAQVSEVSPEGLWLGFDPFADPFVGRTGRGAARPMDAVRVSPRPSPTTRPHQLHARVDEFGWSISVED